jgi:thiopurine S-methyltransferase
MDADFWDERWKLGQIGFHQNSVHTDLIDFADPWLGAGPATVLVPLCGKSLDLAHLAARGHAVIGVELVEDAVRQLMDGFGPGAVREPLGAHSRWTHPAQPGLTVIQGDVLQLSLLGEALPRPTHIWDRAALVALDAPRRRAYVEVLREIAPGAQLLLNVFDYGPDLNNGPPHSIELAELNELYSNCMRTMLRAAEEQPSPGMTARGITKLQSQTWRIQI